MYLWPTRRPLLIIDSAASSVLNQIPIDVDLPRGLSFFFSHVMSSISNPFSMRSFSSKIFWIPCVFPLSRLKSSVGTWCTMIPNWGFTSLVSLPSSSSHVVLLCAVSADWASLNWITYPVFVVLTPATLASLVRSVFDRAVLMCWLVVSVGRNWVKLLLLLLSLLPPTSGCMVVIWMQLVSLWGC